MVGAALILTIIFSVPCAGNGAPDESETVEAEFNLYGYAYVAFIPYGDEGPDRRGAVAWPYYMVLVQDGNYLYGGLVKPETVEGEGVPGALPRFRLRHATLRDGVVRGRRIKISVEDPGTREVDEVLKGKVRRGGDVIRTSMRSPKGKRVPVKFIRVNKNSYFSGLYIGSATGGAAARPASGNMIFGARVLDTRMRFSAMFLNPLLGEQLAVANGVADFDPGTGKFSFRGNRERGQPSFTGTIGNKNIMTMNISFPDLSGAGDKSNPAMTLVVTLYFFGGKGKAPKLKAPAPRAILAGEDSTIRIECRNALPGCWLSDNRHDVKINNYFLRYTFKDCIVTSVRPGMSAQGEEISLDLVNPDGKKATTKKPVKIK